VQLEQKVGLSPLLPVRRDGKEGGDLGEAYVVSRHLYVVRIRDRR